MKHARIATRWPILALGWLSILLAVVGTVLPLLPTVPFLLLAAWCFARSSPALHRWMRRHHRFGPPLREFSTGRIRPATSRRAIATLWIGLALSAALLAWKGSWIPIPLLGCCGVFVTAWIRRRSI